MQPVISKTNNKVFAYLSSKRNTSFTRNRSQKVLWLRNKLKNLKSLVLNGVEAGLQKKRNTHQKSMAQINDERSGVCCLIFIVNIYNHNIIVLFWSDFFINIIGLNASKRGRRKCIFLDQTGLNLALKLKCHTSIKHRNQDGNQSRVQ